jgi:pimeloyl-[acyl-carrier protein] synthase
MMVTLEYNPFAPEVHADPYPVYARLRSEDPVHWSDLMESWVLTRYRDVVAVLDSDRFSAERRRANNRFARELAARQEEIGPVGRVTTMLTADPPLHTRLRGLVNKAFTPRAVERLRPRIQEIVDELLDAVAGSGRMDVIADLAYPLPVIVIAEMLGVSPDDRAQFKRWSTDIAATTGGPLMGADVLQRADQSAIALAEYFERVIAERRREPRDDLLSGLIAAEEQGQVLSDEELLATCILLLVAGNETTTTLIGNGVLALLRHPEQMRILRDDPSLIRSAVEEILRYDPPVQGTGRVALADTEIGGKRIEKGQLLLTLLAAANRDPEQFPNPDELDVTRSENRHLAFGYGIHFCLGAPLARLEGQIAINGLLRRLPEPRLATDDLQWGGSFILRGLKSLPIAF